MKNWEHDDETWDFRDVVSRIWFSIDFPSGLSPSLGFDVAQSIAIFMGKNMINHEIFLWVQPFFWDKPVSSCLCKIAWQCMFAAGGFFLQNMHLCTANSWGKAVRPCFSPWNLQELRWDAHVPCREILAMGPILLIDSRILTRSRHFFGVWIRETWKQPELEVVEYAKNVDIFRSTIALGSIAF